MNSSTLRDVRDQVLPVLAFRTTRRDLEAYFWDIKNRITSFEGAVTVKWLVDDLLDTLAGNPPDPEGWLEALAERDAAQEVR